MSSKKGVSCKNCDSDDVKEVGVTLFPERSDDLYSFICNDCDESFQLFRQESQLDKK